MNTVRALIREFLEPRFQSAADISFNVKPADDSWDAEEETEAEEDSAPMSPGQVTVSTPGGEVSTPSGLTTDMISTFVRDPAVRGTEADPDFETEKRAIDGVIFDSHVTSTVPVNRFLEALRDRVPSEIPIIVASAYRDTSRQASAMLGVWRAGGDKQIGVVYSDLVEKAFMSVINKFRWVYSDEELRKRPPPTGLLTALEIVISGLRASGSAFHTGHMAGRGIDLRISGMSAADADVILNAAKDLGAKAMIEAHPYHLHITIPNEW
jgi:hypothetical protein